MKDGPCLRFTLLFLKVKNFFSAANKSLIKQLKKIKILFYTFYFLHSLMQLVLLDNFTFLKSKLMS